MINDPNYNLPKDAFIRLFDNPIPAGDPARSEAPEWAQELDEVVVWAHMGDNGAVSVKVNGEDVGGGGGDFTKANLSINGAMPDVPVVFTDPELGLDIIVTSSDPAENVVVPVPCALFTKDGQTISAITGSYQELVPGNGYVITGDCTVTVTGG